MSAFLCVVAAVVVNADVATSNRLEKAVRHPALTNSAAATEYEKLLADDQAAQADVQKWKREQKAAAKGAKAQASLDRRIEQRLGPIDKAYADFIRRFPNDARARLDYGCFLNEREDEAGAQVQWERALQLDPNNPDTYHNLAGRYAEIGPSKKAFDFFTKAIELNPAEPVYYHNFADALYVLRKHAITNYGLSEQQVFSRALELYSNAVRLDPQNFGFISDFASTYYALKPLPYEAALSAWTNALRSATNQVDREKVFLHLARVKMVAGRLAEARAQLASVTNEASADLKTSLLRAISEREKAGTAQPEPPQK